MFEKREKQKMGVEFQNAVMTMGSVQQVLVLVLVQVQVHSHRFSPSP